MSRQRGHELLDPHHGHEHLGQRRAHAAVALGLEHADRAGLGDREVGAARSPCAPTRNFAPQVQPGRLGRAPPARRSGRAGRARARTARGSRRGSCGSPARGCATATSSPSWMISSARSVSTARTPACRQRLVELDLVGGDRLDLDHLVDPVRAARCRRRSRMASSPSLRPVHLRRRRRATAASSGSSWWSRTASAASLIACPACAQLLPVGQLPHHRRALGADRRRGLAPGCGAAASRAA